jgi:uncharacterized membrane protein (UPF0127 family)
MRRVKVVNTTRDSVLGTRVAIADRMWSRVRGFLFRPAPAHGEGMLLSPCRAVHMIGVGYPLDVIFVNRHGCVVATYESLSPWRRTAYHLGAEYALELPAGTIAATGTVRDDLLAWLPAESGLARDVTKQARQTSRNGRSGAESNRRAVGG